MEVVNNPNDEILEDGMSEECEKCTTLDKCVDCIIKHFMADHNYTDDNCDDESSVDSEEESIEDIMAKARSFKTDDTEEDIADIL